MKRERNRGREEDRIGHTYTFKWGYISKYVVG